ncbi:uncharacterized protein LOC119305284 [Triticum dicoccoides]|uniref:uncharacterized protein LOC119305284 n=1 Tax=Triticum dicoccoides TaxID=85692 RepID=UPI000E7A2E5A|nr:uncharacterized protein LOC119305284 [Triticum dicoccoides]
MAGVKKFFLWINFLVSGISVGAYVAPMFSLIALMEWDSIYECFVPESLMLEGLNFIFMIAYYCFVTGTGASFDGILTAGFGLSFNFCWLFLYVVHCANTLQHPRLVMASVPTAFLVIVTVMFGTIQWGYKAEHSGARGALIAAVLTTILFSPSMSVLNRLYSSIPDDPWAPFLIKMILSGLSVVTSGYSAWNGTQQGYAEHEDLKYLLVFNYVSVGIGICQIVVRLVGPRMVADHVKRICKKLWQIVKRICKRLWQIVKRICGRT